MIKVKIAEDERLLGDIDEHWINQQIDRRRSDGQSVCVRVTIQEGEVDLILSTPTCGHLGGGGRQALPQEVEFLHLWDKRGLNKPDFTGGNLVAFLKQVKKLF